MYFEYDGQVPNGWKKEGRGVRDQDLFVTGYGELFQTGVRDRWKRVLESGREGMESGTL